MFKNRRPAGLLTIALAVGLVTGPALAGGDKTHTGDGTFYDYDGNGGGSCLLPDPPGGLYTAAMNATDYKDAKACGGLIVVTNLDTGLSVTALVNNLCPECAKGDVDLEADAFAQIAEPVTGRIPISWNYVAYDVPTVKLVFKDGSSQWWTAVQVRDHRYRIKTLKYRLTGSGDDWQKLPRESWNYFVQESGMGPGPYDFKIKDVNGSTITVENISLQVGVELDTGKQFPSLTTLGADRQRRGGDPD